MNISIDEFRNLTYQGMKKVLVKMNIVELEDMEIHVDIILSSLYDAISLFGEDENMTIKDYHIIMKGVKKFEVIKGFIMDRKHSTSYMEYSKKVV